MTDLQERIALIEKDNEQLHDTFETQGINSRGVRDVAGRKFFLPVDEEHKAKVFSIGIIGRGAVQPHLRAFWASTFGFFSSFFSVFAPAALVPYLKKPKSEGGIALTPVEGANAGMAAVGSTIVMRVLCGPMCDKFGARKTFIILLSSAIPGIVGLMFITSGTGLIMCRLVIGLGLASFVACQVWCSQMFTKKLVGIANATAGGWGNLGGGVTQLVMPFVMEAFLSVTNNDIGRSWRLCFLLPLIMHVLGCIFISQGQDLPDGNYKDLEKSGVKQKVNGALVAKIGASNVNAWILALTYGLCFGVELTMNNKVVLYFYTYYALAPKTAGVLGSCFGLMNLFARSWGGLLSDAANKKYGMRGRIWSMWIIQTLEAICCILMGLITINYPNPSDYTSFKTVDGVANTAVADVKVPGTWMNLENRQEITYTFNSTDHMVTKCGSNQIETPDFGWINYGTSDVQSVAISTEEDFLMIMDPDKDCLHNAAPLALTMLCMIFFSIFVQMAEGLHYGVVPYVSRPALGVVSGMVGAGGNLGGVIGSRFIVTPFAPIDTGFVNLGIVVLTTSLIQFGIYFPEHGGMLFKAGGLGSYDPQLIKPPADMRGADQMKYDNAKADSTAVKTTPPSSSVTPMAVTSIE